MTDLARLAGPVALALAGIVATGAQAQEYPRKAIRVIMPSPVGSGPDVDTRSVTAELSKVLDQTVLV